MNTLWLLLGLWIGTMAGFFVFALMAVARNSEHHEPRVFAPVGRSAARARVRAGRRFDDIAARRQGI